MGEVSAGASAVERPLTDLIDVTQVASYEIVWAAEAVEEERSLFEWTK
jgi:hypothetical protein